MASVEIGSAELKEKYTEILRKNGVSKEIKEVISVEPDLQGEHMASTCDYVTIKFTDGSEDLELFVKRFVSNPMTESIKGIFEKEATFFNLLLPEAKKLCQERTGSDKLIDFFPKSYYGDDSLIVLENLIQQGYFMLDKFERQDMDQAKIVLGNMARLHGVFYTLINDVGAEKFSLKYPHAFKEAFKAEGCKMAMNPMINNNFDAITRMLEASKLEGSEQALKWLKPYAGNVFDEVVRVLVNDGDLLVLNHGDCWNNNMMFLKDKETGELINHLFVDLQVTRLSSPNVDIGYFLFTSVRQDVRHKQLIPLLRFYYDVLLQTVKALGTTINVSFDDFVGDYKKKCTMGFWMNLIFFSAIAAMKEVDVGKFGDDLDQMTQYIKNTITNWIDNNPEEAKNVCKEIIDTVNEYKEIINQV